MERNEEEFFSLWCSVEEQENVLILWNNSFQGDPVFNHATRIVCGLDEAEKLVKAVSTKFRSVGVQPCFYVSPLTRPAELGGLLVDKGLHLFDEMQIMSFEGKAEDVNPEITVRKVGASSVSTWAKIYIESFEIPASWETEVRARCAVLAVNPLVNLYVARLGGQDVGCLALYSHDRVGGVYCAGTLPAWRRGGVGSTLLRKAVADSEALGNEILCLQTLGQDRLEGFYGLNGFRTVFMRSIYLQG
ncbi:MAG: GNAT family N-acetyltransferase [Thaumarchaeota archaeon]|nr:GNAT family N-acetyltransferase [Nitrososphaerota archaeon]